MAMVAFWGLYSVWWVVNGIIQKRTAYWKNRAIKRVGDCVRAEYELLKAQVGAENCTLEWNQGGHFQDGDKRLASAFTWCINKLSNYE